MRRSKEEWKTVTEGFDRRSQSLADYCKEQNISVASYYQNKRKLNPSGLRFLPAVIEQEESDIAFECNGYQLKISASMDPRMLGLLLKATQYD